MTISVVPGSASIRIVKSPMVQRPAIRDGRLIFDSNELIVWGECTLTGGAGDDPSGWTLGFIQVLWIETNWAYYRGQFNGDGSTFLQIARAPGVATPRLP